VYSRSPFDLFGVIAGWYRELKRALRRLTSRSTASTTSSLNDSFPDLSRLACRINSDGNRIVTASFSITISNNHRLVTFYANFASPIG